MAEDRVKIIWDIIVMIILIATSIIVPVNLAFSSPDDEEWSIFFYTIDGIFAVDLVVWFFTSY